MLLNPTAPHFMLPPAPSARHPRALALLLGGVLLTHWLLLGQPHTWISAWAPATSPVASLLELPVGPAMQTRTLQADAPTPPAVQQSAPPEAETPAPHRSSPTHTSQARSGLMLPPAELPAAPTVPDALALLQKTLPEPVDTAQTAPDSGANNTPPQPPTGPNASKLAGLALATAATGAAHADDAPLRVAYPDPVRLKYEVRAEVKGISLNLNGELLWQHDGKTYNSRLELSHLLLGSRVQTSKGSLGPQGLEPLRFGDKVRSEVAAHFDRNANKVTFSANTPDVPLTPGMQDQLSAVLQLSAMLAGEPQRYPAGTKLPFEAIGPRSVESWTMVVGASEKLVLPGGEVTAIKLSRGAANPFGNRAEIWLAPSMGYLPVRIRLTEANGDVADQMWKSTQAP